MTRQIIQGTALSQSERTLVVLPGASVQVNGPDGNAADVFVSEGGASQASNPVTATIDGAYSFWVDDDVEYYDLVTTYNGRSVTERVDISTGGGDGTDQTARDAAAAAQAEAQGRDGGSGGLHSSRSREQDLKKKGKLMYLPTQIVILIMCVY